jgi:hypothetical protein
MKRSKALISFIALVCVFIFNSRANDQKHEVMTPEFTIRIPPDHLFLVAIDSGEAGNRLFVDHSGSSQAPGVDPVTGKMMRVPSEVGVSLVYPEKRENPKLTSLWKVYAGYKYTERESKSVPGGGEFNSKVDWDWRIGYTFEVATKVQRIIYQHEGRVYNDYENQIIEAPVQPVLEEVETGIEGTKLYQIPYGEVDGVTRYIVVLVSDSLGNARKVLLISNSNPKFEWSCSWFSELPHSK